MTDEQKALLGDHEAAKRLTEQGVLLPCPFCGGDAKEALDLAISALRGPTREMVEKMFLGCPYCKPDFEGYVRKFGAYSIQNGELETGHCKPQKINFCPHCSRPLTDEAVDMMVRRMEEIYK